VSGLSALPPKAALVGPTPLAQMHANPDRKEDGSDFVTFTSFLCREGGLANDT
jgi:hypothetical protein